MHDSTRQAGSAAIRRAMAMAAVLAGLFASVAATAQTFRIVTPAPEEVVHSNAGNVPVVVTGAPAGRQLRVLLDGEALPTLHLTPAFELEGVGRGEHRLAVELLDEAGQRVERSPAIRFFVWQASRLNPP